VKRVVARGGLPVSVSEWPGEGPPVVLLHGFTGDGQDWAPFARALGRRAVAPDLLGHGASVAPVAAAPYALDAQLGRLEAIFDRLRLGRVVLIGYSLGARLALHLALRRRVRGLVLIGGTPGLADEGERATRRADDAALAATIARDGVAAFLDAWRRRPLIATQARAPRALRAAMSRRRARLSTQGLARTLVELSPGVVPSCWGELSKLTAPTLLVTGAEDAKFDAIAAAMQSRLPRARRAVIAGAGHAPHLERPAACAAAVDHIFWSMISGANRA
jgi:2-succinyl-6-hydroxy-2,4-cyclohexadiene-1-carboxylate synthase